MATDVKPHLSQRDANGSCPTAHIQHCAVLIQLGPFPHSRVQHLCSSCIHLQQVTQAHLTLVQNVYGGFPAVSQRQRPQVQYIMYLGGKYTVNQAVSHLEEGMRGYSEF